jgi:penicillin amidase
MLAQAACAKPPEPQAPPLTPITSGTVVVSGLSAPVRVVRDRWGIPHIYAESADDLFIAQGFVQAEDRLFQMDLWRRASIGRLAEVLGPNFAERDTMTRRMQYRGDMAAEWSSYALDAHAIGAAFVRGVNAWVARAHDNPPDEFRLAGFEPAFWSDTDLLSRTDAFLESRGALDDVRRLKLSDVVADAIHLVGAPPFFVSLAGRLPVPDGARRSFVPGPGDSAVAAPGRAAATPDGAIHFEDAVRRLEAPGRRYLVHLHAPGWNVIGFADPWLPGVIVGHNERMAWAAAPIDVVTQDLAVETIADGELTREPDAIRVKGRPAPMTFERQSTRHGVVIATDAAHNRVFTLRWTGFDPGSAADLAALSLDRAQSVDEFHAALARWKLPPRRFVYRDDGHGGEQSVPAGARPDAQPAPEASVPPSKVRMVFPHLLGITEAARRRYNVGPVGRPHNDSGPVGALFEPRSWERSHGINAPGQSGSPSSDHYRDLVAGWLTGERVLLAFGDGVVRANASETLTLVPR